MINDISDVTVVVCTRNNKEYIAQVLNSILIEKPKEVIVVDGNSTDGTKEILSTLPVKILTDPGKGLALARKIALENVQTKYILYVGDDNIIKHGSILKLKNYMISHDWVGAAFQTRIMDADSNYWSYCANWRWIVRFSEGVRSVIGTPQMFETALLKEAGYDENCSVSDDTDIAEKIAKLTNKKMGYSDIECYEIGKTGKKETITRFRMYGKSDAQFYAKYSKNWTLGRKWFSICHPIRDELFGPLKKIRPYYLRIKVFPYFLFITILRYLGWIKESRKIKKYTIINNKEKS